MSELTTQMIKDIQRWNKWSAQQVADYFGVSKRTVENWRQGRTPSPSAIKMITDLYDKLRVKHGEGSN